MEEKHKAIIVDDDDALRTSLVETLRFADFDAEGYREAEQVLTEVFDVALPLETLPDVLLLDLHLREGRMQGTDLLNELLERDVPTEVLAVSGDLSGADIIEAIKLGTATGIAKPFDDIYEVIKRLRTMAQKGKKRREYRVRNRQIEMDASRCRRPVFLSYSTYDKKVANGIRRHLEAREIPVWYAPTTLQPGDAFRNRILEGIDEATIFIAVLTDNYAESVNCLAELSRFYLRLESNKDDAAKPLTILPVLAGLSEKKRRDGYIRPILEKYQYIDLTERFIDRLTLLLVQIQIILGPEPPGRREPARLSASGKIA